MKAFYTYKSESCSRILCPCSKMREKPIGNYLAPDVHHKLNLTLYVLGLHWLLLEMEKHGGSKTHYTIQVLFMSLLLCFSCLSWACQVNLVAELLNWSCVLPKFKASAK